MSQKLFQELNLRDNVSRNGFSLDHTCKFTAQVGELLPIFHRTVMPGDRFELKVSNFTRTAPVQTAAYTRIREFFDWFFVPYRILQKDLPNILAEDVRNPYSAQSAVASKKIGSKVPQTYLFNLYGSSIAGSNSKGFIGRLSSETNQFGFNRGQKACKLLSYLGYGNISDEQFSKIKDSTANYYTDLFNSNPSCSLLPLAAYQSIFYYWYRNTQWEENQPQNYNFDWMTSGNYEWYVNPEDNSSFWSQPTLFDLQYANYPKDLYFGILPDSQMGDEAEVTITTRATGPGYTPVALFEPGSTTPAFQATRLTDAPLTANGQTGFGVIPVTGTGSGTGDAKLLGVENSDLANALNSSFNSAFSILELRKSEAIQKYKEILGTGENNYKSILEKLFNVNVSDKLANIPYYLGGSVSEVKISEVENNNLVDNNLALLKGKGIGQSNGDTISFTSQDEYGILMCIYHAQPIIDYKLNNIHFDITKVDSDDYAKPIFDSLGMVELPLLHVDITPGMNIAGGVTGGQKFLGYTIRNYDYKTAVNRSLGGFRSTELQHWYSPVDFDYLKDYMDNNSRFYGINSSFFKINPHIVDDIFTVDAGDSVNTDHLRINATFNISAVRPLSRYGVPYAQ